MATQRWLYRRSDGVLLEGGFHTPSPPLVDDEPDFVTYGVAEFPDAAEVDPGLHRIENGTLRAATVEEQATYAAEQRSARFQRTADLRDNLATIALVVRARNVPAWTGMTQAQKVAAVRAEADVWRTIRGFIEDNL
jgi:hypothetical protein